MTSYNVIIPARNEAALIAGTLEYLLDGADPVSATIRVIVICNGCTDATAERARSVPGPVEVIEIGDVGKAAAINHALDLAPTGTVFVMDADIHMRLKGFDRMAERLARGDIDAISPVPHFLVQDSAAIVQRYFRVYARHPYLARGVGGAGIWGVSAPGREALGRLPDIIADDNYVRALFPADRQKRVALDGDTGPLIRTPRTRDDLIRCEARWRSGDAQLAALSVKPLNRGDAVFRSADLGTMIARNWSDPAGLLAYLGIKLLGRITWIRNRARRRHHMWHRDETSRGTTPAAIN